PILRISPYTTLFRSPADRGRHFGIEIRVLIRQKSFNRAKDSLHWATSVGVRLHETFILRYQGRAACACPYRGRRHPPGPVQGHRSEEHTSELQSREN